MVVLNPLWHRTLKALFHTLSMILSCYLLIKEWQRNAFGKAWMSFGLWWDPSQKDKLDKAIKGTERGVINSSSIWSWENDPGVQDSIQHIRATYKPDPVTKQIPKLAAEIESKMSRELFWRGVQLAGVPLTFAHSAFCSAKIALSNWDKVYRGEEDANGNVIHEGSPVLQALVGSGKPTRFKHSKSE